MSRGREELKLVPVGCLTRRANKSHVCAYCVIPRPLPPPPPSPPPLPLHPRPSYSPLPSPRHVARVSCGFKSRLHSIFLLPRRHGREAFSVI